MKSIYSIYSIFLVLKLIKKIKLIGFKPLIKKIIKEKKRKLSYKLMKLFYFYLKSSYQLKIFVSDFSLEHIDSE